MNMRTGTTFSERLRAVMIVGDWERDELGVASEVAVDIISAWLDGEVDEPEGVFPIQAAHAMGVCSRWLVYGEGPLTLDEAEASRATY